MTSVGSSQKFALWASVLALSLAGGAYGFPLIFPWWVYVVFGLLVVDALYEPGLKQMLPKRYPPL